MIKIAKLYCRDKCHVSTCVVTKPYIWLAVIVIFYSLSSIYSSCFVVIRCVVRNPHLPQHSIDPQNHNILSQII